MSGRVEGFSASSLYHSTLCHTLPVALPSCGSHRGEVFGGRYRQIRRGEILHHANRPQGIPLASDSHTCVGPIHFKPIQSAVNGLQVALRQRNLPQSREQKQTRIPSGTLFRFRNEGLPSIQNRRTPSLSIRCRSTRIGSLTRLQQYRSNPSGPAWRSRWSWNRSRPLSTKMVCVFILVLVHCHPNYPHHTNRATESRIALGQDPHRYLDFCTHLRHIGASICDAAEAILMCKFIRQVKHQREPGVRLRRGWSRSFPRFRTRTAPSSTIIPIVSGDFPTPDNPRNSSSATMMHSEEIPRTLRSQLRE